MGITKSSPSQPICTITRPMIEATMTADVARIMSRSLRKGFRLPPSVNNSTKPATCATTSGTRPITNPENTVDAHESGALHTSLNAPDPARPNQVQHQSIAKTPTPARTQKVTLDCTWS
ncbi:hypothetical protein ACFPRL_34270 [Pseudoclavibacter helvolus]